MAFTTPMTFTSGNILTAAQLNTYLRDNVAWIATDSPACRAYNSANFSVATSTVESDITFNNERFDNASVHSTSSNTDQLIIPSSSAGKYVVGSGANWALSGAGTYRVIRIKVNGTPIAVDTKTPSASHGSDSAILAVWAVNVADVFEMGAIQDSGGALNIATQSSYSPEFYCFWFRT